MSYPYYTYQYYPSNTPNQYYPINTIPVTNQPFNYIQYQLYNPIDLYNNNTVTSNSNIASTNNSSQVYSNSNVIVNKETFYCEPCDKDFDNKSKYEAHCLTHEKCRHENCSFHGTRKVVIAHYHSKHGLYSGSGYKMIEVEGKKFNVLLGSSPEDINKWINDRKKRFPTINNQNIKSEQIIKLNEAGGIINTSNKRKFNDINSNNNEDNKSNSKRKICNNFIKGICKYDNCKYNHDVSTIKCNNFSKGNCKRGDKCLFLHDINDTTVNISINNSSNKIIESKQSDGKKSGGLFLPNPLDGGTRGTLLKKLLADEILNEENMILQCFRYIVNNNYFD